MSFRFIPACIVLIALAVFAFLPGCASQIGTTTAPSPMQAWTTSADTYTGVLTAITPFKATLPPATVSKIETDRAAVAKVLDASYADINAGASATTISGDLSLLSSVLGAFETDQLQFANPFPVKATTSPTN